MDGEQSASCRKRWDSSAWHDELFLDLIHLVLQQIYARKVWPLEFEGHALDWRICGWRV